MTEENKKALFYFTAALVLFWFTVPKRKKSLSPANKEKQEADPADRPKIPEPTMSAKEAKANPTAAKAFKALQAYIKALNAGEPQSALDELNQVLGTDLGMNVYRRRSDNKLAVKNLVGKDIIVNN